MAIESGGQLIYRGNVTGLSHHQYGRFYDMIQNIDDRISVALVKNKYDAQACGVFFHYGDEPPAQIGWIPKELNTEVYKFLTSAEAKNGALKLQAFVIQHKTTTDFQRQLFIQVFVVRGDNYKNPAVKASTVEKEEATMQEQVRKNNVSAEIATDRVPGFLSALFHKNLDLAKTAGYMEAGRIANNELTKRVAKRLPMMVRGYLDTPIGRIIVANIAAFATEQFRGDDEHLAKLVEAMSVEAYQELIGTFDIEGMIDEMLSVPKIQTAMRKASGAAGNRFGGRRASEALVDNADAEGAPRSGRGK